MKSHHLRGYLFIALSALILGTNGIFARLIDLPSPILLFYRFFFGALAITVYLFIRERTISVPKTNIKNLLMLGFLNALTAVTAYYAFTHTSIANAEVLLYAAPIYVVILAHIFLKEKIEKNTIISLFISFVGIVLIAIFANNSSSSGDLLGVLAGIFAGISFSLFFVFSKAIGSKDSGIKLNLYQTIISCLFLFPFLLFIPYTLNPTILLLLFFGGIILSGIAVSLYFTGLKSVKAQHVGIISYFEPLSAIVYALFIFGEIPTILTIIGGVLILYG